MGWEKLLASVAGKLNQELLLKIEYLVAENRILRDQISGRPRLSDGQRITLATLAKKLSRKALDDIATIVTPETILRWHRELVARKFDTSDRRHARQVGRLATTAIVVEHVLRFARENPAWGYRRIAGALLAAGVILSHQAVKNILEEHGIDPAPLRKCKTSWSDFIRSHTDCLLATDFFTTEVWTAFGLVTYYVLFFIQVGTRKVYLGGITTNPTDVWMRQAARNLTTTSCELFNRCKYLLRDRDTKFTAGFDMILRSAGIEPVPLPPRSPNLNAFAERFVRSIKSECLDRIIFFGEASFRHAEIQYLEHYHHERPHQGKDNDLLFPQHVSDPSSREGPIHRNERLGGLLNFYYREAA